MHATLTTKLIINLITIKFLAEPSFIAEIKWMFKNCFQTISTCIVEVIGSMSTDMDRYAFMAPNVVVCRCATQFPPFPSTTFICLKYFSFEISSK